MIEKQERLEKLADTVCAWNEKVMFRQREGESYRDAVFRAGVLAGLNAAKANPWLSEK